MDKCPYCGLETHPGDIFCLHCGNRLIPISFSAQPQSEIGRETQQASSEEWNPEQDHEDITTASAWSNASEPTVTVETAVEPPTQRSGTPLSIDHNVIEHPARFVLRADDGALLQEYPLDKLEIAIGRAPNSDILLSKDKLISRRHATVRYENGNYVLRDERSANGTFVNGQQIEEMVPRVLEDGDHVGIGEHELFFHSYESASPPSGEDLPTMTVSLPPEMTYRTRDDQMATMSIGEDENIRVLAREESLNVSKDTVVTGEVSIGKRPVQENQQLKDTVRREEARLDQSDNSAILNDRTTNNDEFSIHSVEDEADALPPPPPAYQWQGSPYAAQPAGATQKAPREKEPTEQPQGTELSLFAIARTKLEDDDRAIVGNIYTVEAGISQQRPDDFYGQRFRLHVQDPTLPLPFDILLHVSDNVILLGSWYQRLTYNPRSLQPQLLSCSFRLRTPGKSYILVNFYRERQWLKTIRFEFESIEKSVLSSSHKS